MNIQMKMNQKKKTIVAHRNDPNDHSVANVDASLSRATHGIGG
jgi:hypothetical protein